MWAWLQRQAVILIFKQIYKDIMEYFEKRNAEKKKEAVNKAIEGLKNTYDPEERKKYYDTIRDNSF